MSSQCTPDSAKESSPISVDDVYMGQDITNSKDAETSMACPASITENRLMRKIDWRLLPMLFVIYIVAFLDR
jgi:hypothetical protein